MVDAVQVQTRPAMIKIIKRRSTGAFEVFQNEKKIGTIDILDKDYRFFAQQQDTLTGGDYIAIGKALNQLNATEH